MSQPLVRGTDSANVCSLLFSSLPVLPLKEALFDSGELQSEKPRGLLRDDLTDCVHRA